MEIGLLVITNGRKAYLERTLASLAERLSYSKFSRLVIVDDSGHEDYREWLTENYSAFELYLHPTNLGLSASIATGWEALFGDVDYIFHLEEDFTFNADIPLDDMVKILDSDLSLAQVALLRQPVNEQEIAAGGIVEQNPDIYTERETSGIKWLQHTNLFTLNPCLYPHDTIENEWLRGWGEREFTDMILKNGDTFAYYGERGIAPLVHHIGEHRTAGWKL